LMVPWAQRSRSTNSRKRTIEVRGLLKYIAAVISVTSWRMSHVIVIP